MSSKRTLEKDRENTTQYRIPALDENGNQKTRVRKGKGTEYLWEKISIPENDWNDHASDRCEYNRGVRERNRLREQIARTAQERMAFILEKVIEKPAL